MLRPDGEGAPNYGPEAQATPPPLGVNFFSTHLRHYGGFPPFVFTTNSFTKCFEDGFALRVKRIRGLTFFKNSRMREWVTRYIGGRNYFLDFRKNTKLM